MIKNFKLLYLIFNICQLNGLGQVAAVYNDIDKEWTYWVGSIRLKNPSDRIHQHRIDGVDITYIIENKFSFFSGEMANSNLIVSTIEDYLKQNKVVLDYDFKTILFN